ncbi:MAG: four helix bundle protein [bacterium]|nr:four helix bundle protein [bacterium]
MAKTINKFTDLIVWQKAHSLMLKIYSLTNLMPKEEKFNITSQIRRSAASASANIAEGFGRYHYQENIQFCRQARGSLEETVNHIIAIRDLKYAPMDECNNLLNNCDEVRLLINGYVNSIKKAQLNDSTSK